MGFRFQKIEDRYAIWIQDGFISLAIFFIFLFLIHPQLLYEIQRPVFFTDWQFLKEHLVLPGGLTTYFSSLFSQLLEYPWISAVLLTGILWSIAFFTRKLIQTVWKVSIHTLYWIPGVFFLLLFSHYRTPLSLAIATAIVLKCTWLFWKWAPNSFWIRLGFYGIFSGLLYWFCGGAFFIFALLCAIGEWMRSKSWIQSLAYLLISIAWCFIGPAFIFLVSLKEACLKHLPIEAHYPPAFARWGLFVFFPLIGVLTFFIQVFRKSVEKLGKRKTETWIAGTTLFFVIFLLSTWIGLNPATSKRLMILSAGRKNDGKTVLRLGKDPAITNPHIAIQVNRALWYTGHLLDSMFVYPQLSGAVGLLPNNDLCFENPEAASDLFFELGLISESLHWGMEFLEAQGQTPEILDRLGGIFLLKGEKETAKIFWRKLTFTLQRRKRAQYLLRTVEEKDLLKKDQTLKEFSTKIPQFDFISVGDPSDRELLILLRQNPRNRMAFEYWVAYELLKGNLGPVWQNIHHFRIFGYTRLPRHVQEALTLYAYLSRWSKLDPLQPYVDYSTLQHFLNFQQILAQNQGDRYKAQKTLKSQFGNTYWYYWMYERPRGS